MVTTLALAFLQAAAAFPGDPAFIEGRVDCHLVDRAGRALNMSFELADYRVVAREGAGLVPNGAEFDVSKQDSSELSLRLRTWYFPIEGSEHPISFRLTDMVDTDYRSINITVLRSMSVPMGHGTAPMQSRLEALGMCMPASWQNGS